MQPQYTTTTIDFTMGTEIVRVGGTKTEILGQIADAYARAAAFDDYTKRKAANTLRAQRADLATFADFLTAAGWPGPDDLDAYRLDSDPPDVTSHTAWGRLTLWGRKLQQAPEAWHDVTHGLVTAFREWMLQRGFAIGTVNHHLSTLRTYTRLAAAAGVIPAEERIRIADVGGYSYKEAGKVDEKRDRRRIGKKKAAPATLSLAEARTLKGAHDDTPQGRRDRLLMALLLDHGLRVGEVVLLQVTDFDLDAGEFRFYRPKVGKTQTHKLTRDSMMAVKAWIDSGDAPAMGPILRGSRKGGELTGAGLSEAAASGRVRTLGERLLDRQGLSAHDCRHYWATNAAKSGTSIVALQQAGGWNSLAMPRRYIADSEVANADVHLKL